ncbi:MAG TPA: serine hydrolase [Ktedonobacterales bacterium]|nr:serine hydrolase [Ktedonobacterales bacterium]
MTQMPDDDSLAAQNTLARRIAALLEPLGGRTAIAARRVPPLVRSPHAEAASEHPESTSPAGAPSLDIRIRADVELPAASLAKLPIAVELFRRTDLGLLNLAERFDTSGEPSAGGDGVLDHLDPSMRLTLNDLCFLMLALSDNTAANFLMGLVGIGEVNHTLDQLKLGHTRLARRFMDFESRAAYRDNVTSAADMVTLLALLRGGALPGAARLREMLSAQQRADDLMAWLPATAQVAHKTGSLDDAFHDAGLLTGPGGTCVFCVMTADQADVAAAHIAVGRILRALWDDWCAGV